MTPLGFLAVGVGGALGCWLRWMCGLALNPWFSNILLGTLTANLAGGYLIGVAAEFFLHHSHIAAEWRLFVIVGFLGGFTTFSAFSAEAISLLRNDEFGWAAALVMLHVAGSLVMTYLGILTVKVLQV